MKRRLTILLGTIIMNSGFLAKGQAPTTRPDPTPIVTPEPVTLPSVALGLTTLLSYRWWRRSRSKRNDS
jgi:hypothetical protein